jgi:muconolactone delta-isomerase
MLADVLHFSFTVSDLDRSIQWYTQVLGLELVHTQRQDNTYTRQLVGVPDAVLQVAQFRLPMAPPPYSTHMLELVQYLQPPGNDLELTINSVGAAHLALMVDDIQERYVRMSALGVDFVNPPVEITEGANVGGFACYFHDPDRITLELLQPSAARLQELGLSGPAGRQPNVSQFLVEIDIALPSDMSDLRRRELLEMERSRGLELMKIGALKHIWRIPGRLANVGIWEADHVDQLHKYLISLPLHPWMDVQVHPLGTHPLEAARLTRFDA